MKKINLQNDCPNSKEGHPFELFVLETLDILFKCNKCNYEYIDIVEKPKWLTDQKDKILKNRNKHTGI
jgi:hypothetical protein